METQGAEIASSVEVAKVDSDATTTETEGSAPSAAETSAAKDQVSPEKKRDGGDERFDKLTRDLYELRAERDRDRYELTAREKRIAELEADRQAKQPEVAPQNTPTLEQFGYDETKYQAALYQHLTQSVGAKLRDEILGEIKQSESQKQQKELYSSWERRQSDFIKSNPDYVDKVVNARSLPIPNEIQAELMQMDDGPQIAYYLVENREKAAAIAKLPPSAQMRELGRIQAQLETKKSAPPVSKAPPPPPKVDATDAPSPFDPENPASDKLPADEWLKRRNKQVRKLYGR